MGQQKNQDIVVISTGYSSGESRRYVGHIYACLSSLSLLENLLLRLAAVFLCSVLVQEILSTRPQYLLNSVSANATSLDAIASKKDFD